MKKHKKILIPLIIVGLIVFYYTPYSYYLQPSFWKFRKMCKLQPEIYQFNGGKIDKEYYNKLLSYYDLDWDTMVKNMKPLQLEDNGIVVPNEFRYYLGIKKQQNIEYFLSFDVKFNEVINISWYVEWDTKRKHLTTKSIASYELVFKTDIRSCAFFK